MAKAQSLKKRGSKLSEAREQLNVLGSTASASFSTKLKESNLFLLKSIGVEILQINLGYMCNQVCEHCHVDAGPDRREIMTKETMNYCLKAIDNSKIHTVDLTGGAPEMNPHFQWFVTELTKRNVKVIVRSNLTILVANKKYRAFPEFFKAHKVTVIASLPCYTAGNVDKQRGNGVFSASMEALKRLNQLGYGIENGLELNLVFNPGGASISPPQDDLEADYKKRLKEDFDVDFNRLFTITNLPISRFLEYLLAIGRLEEYMEKLVMAYNPKAAEGVMCRNTVSVSWEGDLFDCDFNQMLLLRMDKRAPRNIRDFEAQVLSDRAISIHQHCFGCTAGAGSSCQGAIA
jgi:radical SAM/Cys-rich protein